MAKRLGYTTDLNGTKSVLELKFKNTRNWQSTAPFATKDDAAAWEKRAMAEMKCKGDGAQGKPKRPDEKWIGYVFEHDGPA
jgi:hypothetical protein